MGLLCLGIFFFLDSYQSSSAGITLQPLVSRSAKLQFFSRDIEKLRGGSPVAHPRLKGYEGSHFLVAYHPVSPTFYTPQCPPP